MENKTLMVTGRGFFAKIKNFFKSLFGKNKIEIQQPSYDNNSFDSQEVNQSSFLDDIKITPNVEKQQIEKLQRNYENGLITEEDMTQEQIFKIENLYKEQITKLQSDYKTYKRKIIEARRKLAHNNN